MIDDDFFCMIFTFYFKILLRLQAGVRLNATVMGWLIFLATGKYTMEGTKQSFLSLAASKS